MAKFIQLTSCDDGLPVLVRVKKILKVEEGKHNTYISLKGLSYAIRVQEKAEAIGQILDSLT